MNYQLQENMFEQKYGDEYLITLEFQLQRQKQKNKILEQRLKNKQIFIVEMKKMQAQIQLLSQKCRLQLQEQRKKRQLIEKTTLRQYSQIIAQLEHKIRNYQDLQLLKKEGKDSKLSKNKSLSKLQRGHYNFQKKAQQIKQNVKQNRQKQQMYQTLKSFAVRFVQMFQIYNDDSSDGNLKKQLKYGWKWIKNVVKQWQYSQNALKQIFCYAEKCQERQQYCEPEDILSFKIDQIFANYDNEP